MSLAPNQSTTQPPFDLASPEAALHFAAEEARARLLAGEADDRLVLFLRARGMPELIAIARVDEFRQQRRELVRERARRKCFIGAGGIALPFLYNLIATPLGVWKFPVFIPLAVIGTIGIAKLFNGVGMLRRPDSVAGNVWDGTR
jgi:hypothetical protein